MAGNTIRPAAAGPLRANTVRPRVPEPPLVPVEEVPAAPIPVAAPVPTPEPARAAASKPARPTPAAEPEEDWSAPLRGGRQSPGSSWSLFSLLDRFTGLDGLFREGLPVRYLPKLLFVMLLTLLYIGNTHYGNRMNRNIQRLKQETEDLRADYTTLKSDYMEASKQSEVARKVAAIGLVESSSPPFRITVPAGRLDEAELETMPVLTADTLTARASRDSAAAHVADSLQGRARRQQLGLPADDDTPELGAPPPGLADEEAPTTGADSKQLTDRNVRSSNAGKQGKPKKEISTKKSITAQGSSAKKEAKVKKGSDHRASNNSKR
ncbi:FtsL-like putative cell division protein [Hymenobacter ginkgonis]|uniref:FtsL-like putative cell division protein n=1 Tax=Hymenobacter ginkgonis TaxID=2682976 RepID=UPI0018DE101A|nr:FtsL-like putative cell division protein [Hymenobacter ginkgonis]